MTTAQLTGIRKFRVVEEELAEPGPGELQVRVGATGICGSDMHSYMEGGIGGNSCKYPMVLGHEPAGTVVKVGAGVTGWQPGDRGALEPQIFCYHCEFCLRGLHNLCSNGRFMSTPDVPGFFRELVNVPAHNMLPIGSAVSIEEAALMEPLGVALHTLLLGSFRAGETAVVVGTGPIGLLTIAALKLAGAKRIWAVEPLPHRRDMAKAMGASAAVGTESEEIGKFRADIAFDCAAKGESVNQSAGALKPGGRLVLTGIHSEPRLSLDIHLLRKSEIALINVRRSNNEGCGARDLLEEHVKLFAPLITHRRKLADIESAFEQLALYSDGVGKMLIV